MAISVNKVLIAGNLTRKPETKNLGGDKSVTNFGIAINERYKGKDGEMKESVVFLDVEAWNRTGQLVEQYLDKGSACFIEGKLKLDQWEDNGQKRSKVKIVADSVQFLGGKKDGADGAPAQAKNAQQAADDWNP